MAIPTSDAWPCMDVGPSSMPSLLVEPGVEASRGSPYFSIDGDNNLVIYSDDDVSSWLHIDLPVSETATFQVQFKPSALPPDLGAAARYFLGLYNHQGRGGGVLLSRTGLCIVSGAASPAIAFPGSQDLCPQGEDYYTLRLVLDGSTMGVYLTKTELLPFIGHQLRYTSAAPLAPAGVVDGALIEILGTSGAVSRIKLDTLQMNCLEAVIPNQRPTADPGADQTANIGSAVTFTGDNSLDPEGKPLFYRWALLDAPDGTRFKSSGTGGFTIDDGDADGFTNIFKVLDDEFSADNMPLLQPGDHLEVAGVYYQVATTRWTLNTTTGKYERDDTLWNDNELVVTEETIPDDLSNQAWKVLHTATFFSDVDNFNPYAIADKAGLYTVQLTVNDGELDSLPAQALLNVSQTSVPLGCVPDVSWIWNSLSDFWPLVEDRAVVEMVWSGFAQAAAAQLLTAWQVDYNKSLLDIQRTFQRRWLPYSTLLDDDPETAMVRIIRGPIFSRSFLEGVHFTAGNNTLQLILDSGDIETVTFAINSPDPLDPDYYTSAASMAEQINTQLGFRGAPLATAETKYSYTFVKLEYATLLRIRPTGTANVEMGFSSTEYTKNDLKGGYGGIEAPGKVTAFVTYQLSPYDGGPLYPFALPETPISGGSGPYGGVPIYDPPILDFDHEGIGGSDLLVWDAIGYRILKTAYTGTEKRALTLRDEMPDSEAPDRKPWIVPSIVTSIDLDFNEELVTAGDIARFEVKNLTTNTTVEIDCPVLGVRDSLLGFDPQLLLETYAGVPSNYRTRFLGVRRVNNLPVDGLVVEIPRLQGQLREPQIYWSQNEHYLINDSLGRNSIQFRVGTFSALDPPPDVLWAEVTHLDNRPAIEANFGHLVNFSLEALETHTDNLDYLSAVRGLWWAYFGGPALDKVRTGTQILLGLPFAEADGTVESIDASFSTTEGRIVVRDAKNTNVVRTYYYPVQAGLSINAATGELLKVGDAVTQFAPLSGGIEVKDCASDPYWMQLYYRLGGLTEIEKFFRFMVRGDVDTFNLINLSFAIDFVRKIKPHYSFPLFTLLKNIGPTEVDVDDQVYFNITQIFRDAICYTAGALAWDDQDGSGACRNHYDDPPPQFVHDTHRLCPSMDIWAVLAYSHPGGSGWPWDTIWAYDDGGGTDRVPLSGPDSSPPAPYGPVVGIIEHDATVTAGVYHREKTL